MKALFPEGSGVVSARLRKARDMTGELIAQAFADDYPIGRMEVLIAPASITIQIVTDATRQLGRRNTLHEDKTVIYEAATTAAESAFD